MLGHIILLWGYPNDDMMMSSYHDNFAPIPLSSG